MADNKSGQYGLGALAIAAVLALIVGAFVAVQAFPKEVEVIKEVPKNIEVPGPERVVEKEVPVTVDGVTYGAAEVQALLDKADTGSGSDAESTDIQSVRDRAEEEVLNEIQDKYDVCDNEDYDSDEITVDFDNDLSVDMRHNGDLTFHFNGNVDYDDECDVDFTADVKYDESRDDFNADVNF